MFNLFLQTIELGLEKYTWNSVEIPDYIEKAHSIVCMDVFQNLELTQSNSKDIRSTVNEWCQADLDIFQTRDLNISYNAKELESKQKYYLLIFLNYVFF